MSNTLNRLTLVCVALALLSPVGAGTQALAAAEPNKAKDLFEMSIKELMEVSVVTSASRLPQKTGESSVPVYVITAEDIRRSGLTSIPEILQFAPGVDVLKIDRRRYAVGIRGLHETFSDRTTLLVNGRAVDNPVYGGADFLGLPVMVEDIERIEIVRGPGSAAWGANALTGVINIVTKKPQSTLGGFTKTTINEFGDSYTHIRWGEKQGKWSWRASAGYEDIESSDDAIDGTASYRSSMPALDGLMGFSGFEARDFTRNQRFDSEAVFDASARTQMSFGLGHSHIEGGDYEMGGYYLMKDMREDHVRSYARIDEKFDDGASGYVQWFGKLWNANWPEGAYLSTRQHEFEGQYNLAPAKGHSTSVGGSFRWDHINTTRDTPQQALLSDEPLDEFNTGLFAIDRWQVTERLTLEGQLRGDWYCHTYTDLSGRLTALYALDNSKNHILRFSGAKAFRDPLAALRKASSTRIPMGGGLYLINATAPDKLDNEETYSLEAGYTGKLSEKLTVGVNTYYQRFEKLIGYRQTTNFLGQVFAEADNIDGADSWGVEVELARHYKSGKLSAWYAYNAFETDQVGQDLCAFLPARHKAGLTARLFLNDAWTFNANYVFTDTTPGNPAMGDNDVGSSNRLDLTLSKEFNRGRSEVMIGVSDLLESVHDPLNETVEYTGHEVPGRTFFMSLLCRF